MKKTSGIKIFFILALLAFLSKKGYAELIVEPAAVDFGIVKRDVAKKRYIVFKNPGEKPVKIVGIINQCGINLSVSQKVLKPKTVTEAVLDFFSGTALGDFNEKIVVAYEDEDGTVKQKEIKVTWHTKPDIYSKVEIKPTKIDFGKVPLNKPLDFELEITNSGTAQAGINIVKKDTGIDLPQSIQIAAGERKLIKGSLVPVEEGKVVKKVLLDIRDFTSPLHEIEISYETDPFIFAGTNILIKEAQREGNIYKLPVTVVNEKQSLQFVSFETADGEKLKLSEKLPFYVFKNEKKEFYILLDQTNYEKLKKSYFYFTIGVKVD